MMTIRSAKFAHSLDRLRPFPGQGMPEIAMAGKSNVGKSSMINSLLGNSKLARISSFAFFFSGSGGWLSR